MGKYESGGIDSPFAALFFAFAIGSFFDWHFNHPSDAHWSGVGAAFILLAIHHRWDWPPLRVGRDLTK
jgi:hypothetical protein